MDRPEQEEPPAKLQKLEEEIAPSNADQIAAFRSKGLEDEKKRGMKMFLGDENEWFAGVVKNRFEDFLVYEVDLDGNVIHLTSQEPFNVSLLDSEGNLRQPKEISKDEVRSEITEILGEEKAAELWKFVDETPTEEKRSSSFSLGVETDKEKRTKIHKAIKLIPGMRSETKEGAIVVEFTVKKPTSTFGRENWPRDAPQYLQFVLLKSNTDTSSVVNELTEKLRLKSKRVGFAGTKDKRGVTTQRLCAFKVTPKKLLAAVSRMRRISVGNFSVTRKPLRLGDLYGNRFSIVLRDVVGNEDVVKKNMEFVKENGFINYFGLQRFGTGTIPSHDVGRAILQSDWKRVVDLILSPTNRKDTKKALSVFSETGDIQKTMKMLRPYSIEHKVLAGLEKNGATAYYNALQMLPRNMRTLYVHAYQSFIWNEVASQRIQKFGLKPVPGDLVLIAEEQTSLHNEEEVEGDVEDENDLDLKVKHNVRMITQEDLDANTFSITDIVLPLPGYDVKLPGNELIDVYKSMLEVDGLKVDMKHKIPDYSLSGSYRKIIQKPKDLEWDLVQYEDPTIPLFLSDAAKLKGQTEAEIPKGGNLLAVRLSMTLHRSTYATMCLREMMRFPGHSQ